MWGQIGEACDGSVGETVVVRLDFGALRGIGSYLITAALMDVSIWLDLVYVRRVV